MKIVKDFRKISLSARRTGALLVTLSCLVFLAGCGGVSQAEYDAVCAERDALQAQVLELQSSGQAENTDKVTVTVSGTFTAMVREVIPDYVRSYELGAAVVTQFQSGPFILNMGDLAEDLEVGEVYIFEVSPREGVEITAEQYAKGVPFPDVAVSLYALSIADFWPAEEDDYGVSCNDNLVYTLVD